MQLDNPLWHYVSAVYSQPNVEALCLQAQTSGLQVNSVLLCAWLADQHCVYDPSLYTHVDQQWRHLFLQPLRDLRYTLRARITDQPELSSCYRSMKQTELELEKVDIALLWMASQDAPKDVIQRSIESLALSNMHRYQASLEITQCDTLSLSCELLVQALLKSC